MKKSRPRIWPSRRNWNGLRAYLDQQLEPLKGAVSRLANKLQRRLQAQQNRSSWKFDLEEGMLDAGRLARVVANPTTPLSFKVEKDTEFRDTCVTLLLGQFRLHARAAHLHRRDLRRRPGAHAGTLSGQGRDPRLHHPRLEGRAGPRTLAGRRPVASPQPGRLNDLRHIIYKAPTPHGAAPGPIWADDERGPVEGKHRR